jgi:hypothetical protein
MGTSLLQRAEVDAENERLFFLRVTHSGIATAHKDAFGSDSKVKPKDKGEGR